VTVHVRNARVNAQQLRVQPHEQILIVHQIGRRWMRPLRLHVAGRDLWRDDYRNDCLLQMLPVGAIRYQATAERYKRATVSAHYWCNL
jgi:hypothetical protein